ncbi:MAG: GH116 family glycosyl hydrolase [Capsulimonadales bacterium]|nr:GH116 family glycosyl hydrolase [Capsulimonadales bacterium]
MPPLSSVISSAPTSAAARTYSGLNLLQIAMPLGGIGAGCICLNGYGGLQDFSIRNVPAITAMPDGHFNTDAAFALLHIKGEKPVTRLVEGPLPPEKIYDQGLQGQGYRKGGHEGMPRFTECVFEGQYPFGTVRLSDADLPLAVTLTGWSPFIPGDDVHSGIPAAILDYTFVNTSERSVEFEFSCHQVHPVQGKQTGEKGTRNAAVPGKGVLFSNIEEADSADFGSAALFISGADPAIKAMWFRGGWFDSLSALWRDVSTGSFRENDGSVSRKSPWGRNGGSVLVRGTLEPGASATYTVVLAWHFPNCHQSVGVVGDHIAKVWKPFYATKWQDAADVASYVLDNVDSLRQRTTAFKDALFSSTLPAEALDAISANLAILKSPTVLRQANGNLWGWEGCFAGSGCCHGTCTHVWNYAQAFPHLFPKLERTLREQEYLRSIDGRGHVNFRAALPDAPTSHDFHAAADGQLGGLLKLYRDWQISGDSEWLARLYPLAKRSMDYCILIWDPEKRGALFEPHHNTYDIEFWGPDGMCSTVYIGALCATAAMARALGKDSDAAGYEELAKNGASFLDTELFNGEYYIQKVQWEGLRDTSFAREVAAIPDDGTADEMAMLLKQEGPKYQYGTGCLADGVIGEWMATLYGIETPLSKENVQSHLRSLFAYNFKADLSEHACLQRPGYALGSEPGLLLCSWPRGGKPTLPFVYSDEVWTGIEYQVAVHMILEGLVEEGLTIVRAARQRYDGRVRNPYNEYECGNYYARAMASYGLLGALSGFRYSAVTGALTIAPVVSTADFRMFFSTDSGYGTLHLTETSLEVRLIEGSLRVDTVRIGTGAHAASAHWGVTVAAGETAVLTFA